MIFLDQLNARLAVKKQAQEIAKVSPLEAIALVIKNDIETSNNFEQIMKAGKLGMRHGVRHAPSKEEAKHHGLMAQHHHVHALGSMRSTPEMDKAHADAEKVYQKAKEGKASQGDIDTAEKAVGAAYAAKGQQPPAVASPDAKPSLNPAGNKFSTRDKDVAARNQDEGMTSQRAGEMELQWNGTVWDTPEGHRNYDRAHG